MNKVKTVGLAGAAIAVLATSQIDQAEAGENLLFDPDARWSYVSDRVMGGVSDGAAKFATDKGVDAVTLTGSVSVENNGGFIQFRSDLPSRLDEGTEGIRLRVKGNGERYYVHLRTTRTLLPWHYYQAEFETASEWQEVTIPLAAFKPSARMLPGALRADTIRSVGIVAYGREHEADVSVASVAFR